MLLLSIVVPMLLGRAGLFVTVALGPIGAWSFRQAWLIGRGRIVLSAECLFLDIPEWNHGWLRRGRPVSIRWAAVKGVTWGWVDYNGTAVQEFTVHTKLGNYVLTKSICSQPTRAAEAITRRMRNAQAPEAAEPESGAHSEKTWTQLTPGIR